MGGWWGRSKVEAGLRSSKGCSVFSGLLGEVHEEVKTQSPCFIYLFKHFNLITNPCFHLSYLELDATLELLLSAPLHSISLVDFVFKFKLNVF